MELKNILTINGGSSSIKFALFDTKNELSLKIKGKLDKINTNEPEFTFIKSNSKEEKSPDIKTKNYEDAAKYLLNWLKDKVGLDSINAAGHRIVHGMEFTEPQIADKNLLDKLHSIESFDPQHLPHEIKLLETFINNLPEVPHVACFDTAFHQTMPEVAKLLAIPRKYYKDGIRRYGFHGISYSYIMKQLSEISENTMREKIIIAHLGNGASLAAVKNGKSIDTSMGFTPTAGIPMSTRSGDLDPGVAMYLSESKNITTKEFYKIVNEESGLLGISETSSDMRDLLKAKKNDIRAAEAIDFFCYHIKKYIGAYAAALGGLDAIVFTGGIGENVPLIRERICSGLDFLGIQLDEKSNKNNQDIISNNKSKVTVRVIPTNEELMIAHMVKNLLSSSNRKGK